MVSRVIQTAGTLRLFTLLASGWQSVESLAHASRASVQGIQALLKVLRALNVVSENKGRWTLCPEIAAQLPSEEALAGLVGGYQDWLALEEAVRSGRAQAEPSYHRDAASMRQFLLNMHLSSLPIAQELATHLPVSTLRRVLDLGGGLGTYAIAICQRFPEATAIVLELPQVAAIGTKLVAGSAFAERVRFLGGNYLTDPFPPENDLILMCNILHQEKPNAVRRLFRKAVASLTKAGWIVIHETLVDDEDRSLAAALASLNSLLYYGSRNYSEEEIIRWLEAEGLVVREIRKTVEPGARIILAQQPDR